MTEPATDWAALRDRIAEAVRTVELRLGHGAVDVARRGLPISVNLSEAEAMADVVLSVLTKEADLIVAHGPDHGSRDGVWMDCHCAMADDMRRRAAVRRVAAETPQPATAAALLSTRCNACQHTLNWHRNDVGCTAGLCVCGRFRQPSEEAET
jgi:hypothetical protein